MASLNDAANLAGGRRAGGSPVRAVSADVIITAFAVAVVVVGTMTGLSRQRWESRVADGRRSAAGAGRGAAIIVIAMAVMAGMGADDLRSSPSFLRFISSRMCQRRKVAATRTQDSAGGPHGARSQWVRLGTLKGRDEWAHRRQRGMGPSYLAVH